MAASSSTPHTRKRTRATKTERPTLSKSKTKPRSKTTKSKKQGSSLAQYRDDNAARNEDDDEKSEKNEKDAYDSDAIDEDDFVVGTKRKRNASRSSSSPKKSKTTTPQKRKAKSKKARLEDEGTDAPESEDDLVDQEIVGVVVQAPRTGQVPPGQVSQNSLDFLAQLKDPECNDRQWFKLHEPLYRQAENEWKAFVEAVTNQITEADPQVPPLPPKDVIHRIYRDIRFSNDKTPYKTHFSASFSRSGRKGIWAGLQPGGESVVAAGSWCPARNELMNIRANLQRQTRADRLREVISAPEFVAYFGDPRPSTDGSRQSIFGREDELKVAPKGVDKNHRDLDLLKCRSFAVVHRFLDSEVLAEDFVEKVGQVVQTMRPFVHCLNDMMTVAGGDTEDGGSGDDD